MITIVKRQREKETYTQISVQDLVRSIRIGEYRAEQRKPSFRFAAEYARRNGELVRRNYNGLLVLSIQRLPGEEELSRIREDVKHIPYTHLCWRNKLENTLYIVCRISWAEGAAPTTEEEMVRYQENAYKQLHYLYSTQLRLSIDTERPDLDDECPWSWDEDVFFHPDSMSIFVDSREVSVPVFRKDGVGSENDGLVPGMDSRESMSFIYYNNLDRAREKARSIAKDAEEEKVVTLQLLAMYCHKSGLPMYFPVTMSRHTWGLKVSQVLVQKAFETEYADELMANVPYGKIPKSTLLTLRTEAFLKANYELRRNALTGNVEYRERHAFEFDFQPLTEMDLNSMTIRALKAGLESWDKDVRRLVNSNDIRIFNPLDEYLYRLPQWDGQDRVQELADRIPTDTPNVARYLHIWLLSMVAHWLGKDPLHGNAVVPLLIGAQGCGKTTFASILLPHRLRQYFNDKVDFRSETDIMSALSNFALINIDEFDSVKKSQQPILKYLLTKSKVKFRPAYEKSIVERRRYASFFATTNITRPLVDRTGSRRFICIRVRNGELIDTATPINYDQLYAQLMQEIYDGKTYWFNAEETQQIQAQNAAFMRVDSLSEMVEMTFQQPAEGEDCWLSVDEIVTRLQQAFPTLTRTNNTNRELGRILHEKGFAYKKAKACAKYNVSPL